MFRGLKRQLTARRKSVCSTGSGDGNLSEFDEDGGSDEMETSSACGGDGTDAGSSGGGTVNKDDLDVEGLTLITVDDGKGGLKHVRVSKPPEGQEDSIVLPATGEIGGGVGLEDEAKKPSLGNMLKKEFKGRTTMFQIEHEKLRKRIVSKKGIIHIGRNHMEHQDRRRFISDFFNTMLDMKWRYVLTIFCLSFFLSWLAFAVVWWVITYAHGDFQPDHLPAEQAKSGWNPCVYGIHNFASCFLFSLETQHTIGYGGRMTTEECPEAILVMSFQSVIGVIIQACMVGTIFAKLTRPKKRAQTLLFSKNATVCYRDGFLCLCFRLANMRQSQLVETHVRAILVSKKVTVEGEIIPFYQTELQIGTDMEGEEDTLFFIWPATIMHRIDETSPFYNMSATDFLKKRYEIIVVLEGIVEPTGMSIQARSSYLPNEILWGYRFANVLNFKRIQNEYQIDYGAFNKSDKIDTPSCSARAMTEYKSRGEDPLAHPSLLMHSSEQKLFRRSTIEGRPSARLIQEPRSSLAYSPSDVGLRFKGSNKVESNHVGFTSFNDDDDDGRKKRKRSNSFKVGDEIMSAGYVAASVSSGGHANFNHFVANATPTTPVVML
jgi:potassium inwardly-rectifying channel subfamily J